MTILRVVVIDDHPLFREGVIATLARAEGVEVVGSSATAEDAVRLAADLQPAVILLDVGIPGGGLNALKKIVDAGGPTSVIMLSASERFECVWSALRAGAIGYLRKGIPKLELVAALARAKSGHAVVDTGTAVAIVLRIFTAPSLRDGLSKLTVRERRVLDGLTRDLGSAEIAECLRIPAREVERATAEIARKLDVTERLQPALALLRAREISRSWKQCERKTGAPSSSPQSN